MQECQQPVTDDRRVLVALLGGEAGDARPRDVDDHPGVGGDGRPGRCHVSRVLLRALPSVTGCPAATEVRQRARGGGPPR